MRKSSGPRIGSVTLSLLLAVFCVSAAESSRASPGKCAKPESSGVKPREQRQLLSDPDAILTEIQASRREAFRVVGQFVIFGVSLIVFVAVCVAYVLIYSPSEIKSAKPFNPEKERKETNSRRHLLP